MDGQSNRQNNSNTKHKWDRQEDDNLIECLLQLAQSGNWRADNGTFRSGFLQQLEQWMHDKIPNCQIKATPHISSRVKLWKKQYYALSEMLGPNASGFGWNDNEKSIICEKDVYDDWVKSHPSATGLRGKSFSFLEQWSVVFGKDCANGLGAESLADAAEDIEREEATNEVRGRNVEVDMNNNLDNEELDDNPVEEDQSNVSPTRRNDGSTSRRTRKRRISSTDMLNESIGKTICSMENMFGTASENIAKLAGCFQFMADDAAKKDRVSAEIDKIQGLSGLDRIKAGAIISGDTSKTTYFFSLADDKKLEYVIWVLGGCQM